MNSTNKEKVIRTLKKAIIERSRLKKELEKHSFEELKRNELEGKGYVKGRATAARYAGVSPSTIDRWRELGLKHIKKSFKSDLFFEIKELDRFLKKDLYGR